MAKKVIKAAAQLSTTKKDATKTTVKKEPTEEKVVAKDKEHLKEIIDATIRKNGLNCDLNFIDVSKITDMSEIFCDTKFNGDISKWDVSNVTNMCRMFRCSKFNGDISKWDVSNVTNMCGMFCFSKFNGDISKWNVSNVTIMSGMFQESQFNSDISKWDVSKVTEMIGLFSESKFNGDISKWNVSNVKIAHAMFFKSKFTGDISEWKISKLRRNYRKKMFDHSALEKTDRLPEWFTGKKKAKSSKTGVQKTKGNMYMLNTIVMNDAQIKKFNTLYGEKLPDVFSEKNSNLKKLLSGKVNFETKENPPFETYEEMAKKGLEFEIRWKATEFMPLESWGVGKGKAKDGKLWYCIDFYETRGIFLEDYGKDWEARFSKFAKHVDEFGNNCEIKKFQVIIHGNGPQKIFALPVKKMIKTGKGIEKGHFVFKIPEYLIATYDSANRDYGKIDMGEELRCFTKDGKSEVYLLNKKGKKIKSIADFDHSEPDKDGDVYYPVPASDLEKGAKNKPLTKEAVLKWEKTLGIK